MRIDNSLGRSSKQAEPLAQALGQNAAQGSRTLRACLFVRHVFERLRVSPTGLPGTRSRKRRSASVVLVNA